MSVKRGNGQNGGHFYSNVTQPVKIFCNFIVDAANGNGLGIRSLKSNGYVQNVFMHTSATPGSNNGFLNPNPQSGTILVQLKNNFNYYLGGSAGFVSPVSGTPILVTTGTTLGLVYVIVSVGTTSLDQWQKLGLPAGITPAVGVSFVAKATTTATGTGAIEVPAAAGSGITNVEVQGDSKLSNSSSIAQYSGMWIISNCFASGVLTAPAADSVCAMTFEMDASSVTIDGL
jgi:hypothetical protein